MRKTAIIIVALLLLNSLILSGCYNRLEVDDTVVVTSVGADLKGGKNFLVVQLALSKLRPEGGIQRPQSLVLSETAYGWAVAARRLSLTLPRVPLWSTVSTFIIGEKLAKENVGLLIDFFTRNRFLRSNLLLFVSCGASPDEVLKVDMPPEDYSGIALEKIVRMQEKQIGIYMPVTLRDFLYKSATPGIEPVVLQVIIVENGNQKRMKLEGTAVFRGTRMVGSLNEQESRGFRYLSPHMISGGLFTVKSPESSSENKLGNIVTLELVRSQALVEPVITGDSVKMKIKIKAEGNFYEQQNTENLSTEEMIEKLEKAANKAIEKDIEACIKKAQLLNSDILGWGLKISQNSPREWKKLKNNWPQHFSQVDSEISVDYKIRRNYLIDKPFKFL